MSYSYAIKYDKGDGEFTKCESLIPLISILELGPARFLAHRGEIDGLPVRQYQLVFLVIHETLFLLLLFLLIALDSHFVRVLTSKTIRIDVSVLTAGYAIYADRLFLVRSVVVFKAPRDGTIRVVMPVSPDYLQNIVHY